MIRVKGAIQDPVALRKEEIIAMSALATNYQILPLLVVYFDMMSTTELARVELVKVDLGLRTKVPLAHCLASLKWPTTMTRTGTWYSFEADRDEYFAFRSPVAELSISKTPSAYIGSGDTNHYFHSHAIFFNCNHYRVSQDAKAASGVSKLVGKVNWIPFGDCMYFEAFHAGRGAPTLLLQHSLHRTPQLRLHRNIYGQHSSCTAVQLVLPDGERELECPLGNTKVNGLCSLKWRVRSLAPPRLLQSSPRIRNPQSRNDLVKPDTWESIAIANLL